MTKQQLKRAGLFILVLILALALCQALLFPFSEYDTNQDMGFYDDDMNYRLEDGKFILYMGGDSRNCLSEEVDVKF